MKLINNNIKRTNNKQLTISKCISGFSGVKCSHFVREKK